MKCPHCDASISIFSREMNRFKKKKTCPHCNNVIQLFVCFKVAALLFIPTIFLSLTLNPVFVSFGLSGSLATGLSTGMLILISLRLKAA